MRKKTSLCVCAVEAWNHESLLVGQAARTSIAPIEVILGQTETWDFLLVLSNKLFRAIF